MNLDWPIAQLERLAQSDPERVLGIFDGLFESDRELFVELAIAAVDQEQLSTEQAAELMGISVDDVEQCMLAYRRRDSASRVMIAPDMRNCARLVSNQVAIWEIVREHRKVGSLEELTKSYPSLTPCELESALAYAADHTDEIEARIEEFELVCRKRKAEYPFS